MSDSINVGTIVADCELNTSKLERSTLNAENALHVVRKAMVDLVEKFQAGGMSATAYADQMRYLKDTHDQFVTALNGAAAAHANAANGAAAANKAAQQMGAGFARAGMQFGYMVDDVQYGVHSIINNIAPLGQSLAMGLGASQNMSMGIASGAQIAAVAVYQLYVHWDDLMGLMEIPTVRTQAEDMANLANKTGKTADEQARLNKYKREEKEIDDLLDRKSKADTDADRAVNDAIAEAGPKKVLDGVFRALIAEGRGAKMTDQDKENMDVLNRDFAQNDPYAEFKKKEITDRIEKENIARARDILSDPAKRDTLVGLAERNPGAFPKKFAGNVREATAAGAKQNKEVDNEDNMIDEYSDRAKDDLDREKANDRVKQEAYDEDDRQFQAGIERRKQETDNRDKRRKEVVAHAKKDSPGIDKYAQTLAAGSMVGDISPEEAMTQIRGVLKANDQEYKTKMEAAKKTETKDDDKDVEDRANNRADYAGKKIMEEAERDVMRRATHESLKDEKFSKSEQFDAAALAGKVQGGVNNGVDAEQKKHTSYLDQAVKYLAKIARADGGNNPWAAFEEGS